MTPCPFRPLPLRAECALDTIAPYAAAYIEGRMIAARPVIAFEVYDIGAKPSENARRFVLVSRRPQPAPLMRFIPGDVPDLIAPTTGAATVGEIFRSMAGRNTRVALVMVARCGGALFLRTQSTDPMVPRIRGFNRRARAWLAA